jgi:hypothetical protein
MPFSFLHHFFSRAIDAEAKSSAAAGLCSCNYKPKFSWKMHNKCYLINILLSIKSSSVQQNLHAGEILINDFLCFLGNSAARKLEMAPTKIRESSFEYFKATLLHKKECSNWPVSIPF